MAERREATTNVKLKSIYGDFSVKGERYSAEDRTWKGD
jgi:hypothetical protein